MSSRHQKSALFTCLLLLLLLAATSAVGADGAWSCITDPDGSGWTCTGQGKSKSGAPATPPAAKKAASTASKPAATITESDRKRRYTSPPARARTASASPTKAKTTAEKKSAASKRLGRTNKSPAAPIAGAGSTARNTNSKPRVTTTSRRTTSNDKKRTPDKTEATVTAAVVTQGTKPRSTAPPAATTTSKSDMIAKPPNGPGKVDTPNKARSDANGPTASAARTERLHNGLEWEYCGRRPAKLGPASLPPPPGEEDPLYVGADTFDYDRKIEILALSGNVEVIQGSRYVGADRVTYDRGSTDLVARGNAVVGNPGMRLVADEAKMNLGSDKGSLTNVEYRLFGKINARGTADRAELVHPELTQYENIVYTTCRPGQKAWSLDAEKLELDQSGGWGVARNAKLRVGSVPILYTPYLSFPIDDRRKSGILVPTVGNSGDNGIDVTVPYYWNIAPNMDATFFPRYMSKRGGMLGTEFRYLSERQTAELYGEIIPEDRNFENGGTRWAVRVEHKARIARRWSTNVNFNQVSDDQYLEDFGNNLDLTSIRNIERRGDLIYTGNGWSLLTRLLDYQTVDPTISPTNRPYARLPQLLLTTSPMRLDSGIQLGVDGEYDYFRHEVKVQGHRAALQPYATWPMRKSYGHLIPKLNLYLGAYGLQDSDSDSDSDMQGNPSYTIPSFSLDGGLVFERTVQWFDHESLQTLEPRIFYLYTPYVDQEDIPVFDSTELSFSYSSLFRGNRFTGRDRIGDANQLTLGLSTRTLAQESGRELLRASVGQILYFRDRDVQISGPPEDASSSSIAGELSARLMDNLTGRATFEWDPNEEAEDRFPARALELHYETRDDRLLNVAYRFNLGTSDDTSYENTDLSFSMPVSPDLKLVGRWYYSLLNSETIEAFAGVEYGQCCWRLRLLGQHLKRNSESTGSNAIMVQMELAGLGSVGQQVEKFLERGIYGYHAD